MTVKDGDYALTVSTSLCQMAVPLFSSETPKLLLFFMQNGEPISKLNELECVGDSIYANVWMTNNILRINKHTGKVTGVIDASGLLTPEERAQTGSDGVLNGIAYDPDRDVFLVTGKLWPKLFEVKFVPKIDN